MKNYTVTFLGPVQGVGFRYTVRALANRFDVTGYVKNMTDGSVELVVEAKKSEFELFLQAINKSLVHYIRYKKIEKYDADNLYTNFEIRF